MGKGWGRLGSDSLREEKTRLVHETCKETVSE